MIRKNTYQQEFDVLAEKKTDFDIGAFREKICIVEDKDEEFENAKDFFGNVAHSKNLGEALKMIKNYDFVITDLFYPLGSIQNQEEFQKRLAIAMREIYKRSRSVGLDTFSYYRSIEEGTADEYPAGMLLGIYAYSKGKDVRWISSMAHHSAKSEVLTQFLRGDGDEAGFFEGQFIEGTDENSRKRWPRAFLYTVNQLIYNSKSPGMNKGPKDLSELAEKSEMVELALDLPKYFEGFEERE